MKSNCLLYILVGAPGAGKTTWARKQKITVLNIDEKRKEVAGDWVVNPNSNLKRKAFVLAIKDAKKLLNEKGILIWDGTNLKHDRVKIIQALKHLNITKIAVVFTSNLSKCLKQNKLRTGEIPEEIIIDRFKKLELEPPDFDEGFDSIIFI